MAMPTSIWSGVFRSFSEVVGSSDVFDGARWLNRLREQLDRQLAQGAPPARDYPLAVAASMLANPRRPLRIVDVGGGLGAVMLAVAAALPNVEIEGHIVERDEICGEGRKRLRSQNWLSFHNRVPHLADIDIVHFGSTLHYIEDWKELLVQVTSDRPKSLVMSELPIGDMESFVTAQQYYEDSIPVWFFNRIEFVAAMQSMDYTLVYEAAFLSKVFGREMQPPMDALPERMRLSYFSNLIFRAINQINSSEIE